ncbi:MAG TPA: tetratricopeptide repeat protein [Streptosporangiaceae bacterium]|jgi:tetratricopeptide (TPR) repeat protein
MSENVAAFGVRLSACRQSARLSQQELSERSGLSIRAISNLERGRTRWPYQDSVRRLADALELRGAARAEFIAAAGRRVMLSSDTDGLPPDKTPRQPGRKANVPRQLPAAVRHFVGRESELAALTQLADQLGTTPSSMVVSAIGGTAGVGKTALALHWAHQAAGQFPDGQLYVNLRGYDAGQPLSAGDALAGFLRALGVDGQDIPGDADERAAVYRSILAGRRMLVVLDNARQAEQVRPLLPGSPTCMTVVTSRDALTGLVARDGAVRLEMDLLPLPEAVSLLRVLIGSRVDGSLDDAVTLASQCCRLPLALRVAAELAVARPEDPLSELARELSDLQYRLDALEAGLDERAAVRTVFSWSYRHLSEDTARAFRLAGLHPGPVVDGYALAALTGTSRRAATQQLQLLARAHLIYRAEPGRYGAHDLLRGYALELAATADSESERRASLTRLLDYYLGTAAVAMDTAFPAERHRRPAVGPPPAPAPDLTSEPAALAWLGAELPCLVAAAAHAAEQGWPEHATRLSATLFRYLDTASLYPEALTIHGHARRAAGRTGDRAAEADALISLGLVDGHQGRYALAAERLEGALSRYEVTGDRGGQARALNYLGLVCLQQGRSQEAASDFRKARDLFASVSDRTGEAYALSNLGALALRQGDHQQATGHQQQALALLRELDDRHGEASILTRLGFIGLQVGQYTRAANQFQQALARYRELGDRQGEANVLGRLGLVSLRQGHYRQAISRLRQALTQYGELGDPSGQAIALNGLGQAFLAAGRPGDARGQHAAALSLAVQSGDKYEQARAHDGLAGSHQASGDPGAARRHWQKALTCYDELGAPEANRIRALLAAAGDGRREQLATPAHGGFDA